MRIRKKFADFLFGADTRSRIVERIKLSGERGGRKICMTKDIAKSLNLSPKKIASECREMEKDGMIYKLVLNSNFYWGVMDGWFCSKCGGKTNPSESTYMQCSDCDFSWEKFSRDWMSRPICKEVDNDFYLKWIA